MVVGLPYPFVDGGGDLTCSQRGVVTHYLCVKCGELSMKVVWQAVMSMV